MKSLLCDVIGRLFALDTKNSKFKGRPLIEGIVHLSFLH